MIEELISNPSCLSEQVCIVYPIKLFFQDNQTTLKYGNSINSSLTILAASLQSNRTYQFMVQMENRRNSSVQATGYVLVKVEDTRPQMIAIG